MNGKVIANGQSTNNKESADMKNSAWFQSALKTRNGESYGFNIMKENEGGKESTSLVFSCKVHRNGDVSKDTVGILGIVFKWESFIEDIFNETPLNGNELDTSNLFILDSNGNKLSESKKNKIKFSDYDTVIITKRSEKF